MPKLPTLEPITSGPGLWATAPKNRIRCAGEIVRVDTLRPDPNNANLHPEASLTAIKDSLAAFGQMSPITVRAGDNTVMKGNGTLESAKELGWETIAVSFIEMDEIESMVYGVADNRTAQFAQWDMATLARIDKLRAADGRFGFAGFSLQDLLALRGELSPEPAKVSLSERFLVPPFSVLDARQGYWQDRKRAWLALGIQSELGRGDAATWGIKPDGSGTGEYSDHHYTDKAKANATPGGAPMPAMRLGPDGKTIRGDGRGRPLAQTFGSGRPGDLAAGFKKAAHPIPGGGTGANSAYMFKGPGGYQSVKELQSAENNGQITGGQSGTSIFDPVLCELAYRWFCPPGGRIFDPFAGGSVRGIVAAKLGRKYLGLELRPEQTAANEKQLGDICPGEQNLEWLTWDAQQTAELANPYDDFLFSCPPYGDLERYSDDPRDLSTMDYAEFLAAYRNIIAQCAERLKIDRFACFVVGDYRDRKTGFYRNFVSETIAAFHAAGLELYNEAILVTAVGSLPIRVGKQFAGYRKLGKTHQQVLVFCKGNPTAATAVCGPVEIDDLEKLLAPNGENIPDA